MLPWLIFCGSFLSDKHLTVRVHHTTKKGRSMKIEDLKKLEAGQIFEINSGEVTKELVFYLGSQTAFQTERHIRGERTILSDLLHEGPMAFMCAAGTITTLYVALSKLFHEVWQLQPQDEKFVLKMGEALFLDPNPEGGILTTFFTIRQTKETKFAKYPNSSVIVAMDCKIINTRKGVIRKVLTTNLILQFVEEGPVE